MTSFLSKLCIGTIVPVLMVMFTSINTITAEAPEPVRHELWCMDAEHTYCIGIKAVQDVEKEVVLVDGDYYEIRQKGDFSESGLYIKGDLQMVSDKVASENVCAIHKSPQKLKTVYVVRNCEREYLVCETVGNEFYLMD